jgi:hypothetical protein
MSLSDLLAASQQNSLSDDQATWRQYVLDHLDYIAGQSQSFTIDAVLINQYRYDLTRYLKNELSRQLDIAWIVLLLNDMANDFDFDQPGNYKIPTDRLINDLYHVYIAIVANS